MHSLEPRSVLVFALGGLLLTSMTACRDDAPVAADTAGDSGTDGEETGRVDDDGDDLPCLVDEDCDHDDPCLAGTCSAMGCAYEPIASNACRPSIDVEYPPRAATLQSDEATVIVRGQVQSGLGTIETATINGDTLTLDESGRFEHPIAAAQGGNTFVIEVEDASGQSRRRVQSFVWATDYRKPSWNPREGVVPEGLAIYLDQDSLDDDDPSLPIDDLASLLELAIASTLDVDSLFPESIDLGSAGDYDVTFDDLGVHGGIRVDLLAEDTGLFLRLRMVDFGGTLNFTCTDSSCEWLGDAYGAINIAEIANGTSLLIHVDEDHRLRVQAGESQTSISGLSITTQSSVFNFLIALVTPLVEATVFPLVEAVINDQLAGMVTPFVEQLDGFALDLETQLPIPHPARPDEPILVDLDADFERTEFHDGTAPPEPSPPQGAAFILRGGAHAAREIRYENLGIPSRQMCGTASEGVSLARDHRLEIGITDDFVNQLLYAVWSGGLLDLPLGEVLGGGGGLPVSDLELTLDGMLAPTVSDCGYDELVVHIGDLRMDASLVLTGDPIDFTAFTSLALEFALTAGADGIGFEFGDIVFIETELTIQQDESIDLEPFITSLLESQIRSGVVDALGGAGLGGFDLPDIDVSETFGLEPGTAVLGVQFDGVERIHGTSLLYGQIGAAETAPD